MYIRYFLLLNHTVYSYNFTVVQYVSTLIFSLTCNLTGKDSQYTEIILPIMLALCMVDASGTYYAQNNARIIGWCLESIKHNASLIGRIISVY